MRILNVKDAAVTQGVLDKDVSHEPDLIEVTFMDDQGVPRTVYAHRDGPFKDPEAIAQAAVDGTLHSHADEQPERDEPLPPQGEAHE